VKPALVRRLPKVVWRVPAAATPVPESARAEFPELAPDLAVLDDVLVPTFSRYDTQALRAQNDYRRQQLVLIGGSALATIFGVLQAASAGGSVFGWSEAVLAGLLAPVAVAARGGRAHRRYLASRLKAERLRSEYFVFLARAGEYGAAATDEARTAALRDAVDLLDNSEGDR